MTMQSLYRNSYDWNPNKNKTVTVLYLDGVPGKSVVDNLKKLGFAFSVKKTKFNRRKKPGSTVFIAQTKVDKGSMVKATTGKAGNYTLEQLQQMLPSNWKGNNRKAKTKAKAKVEPNSLDDLSPVQLKALFVEIAKKLEVTE